MDPYTKVHKRLAELHPQLRTNLALSHPEAAYHSSQRAVEVGASFV